MRPVRLPVPAALLLGALLAAPAGAQRESYSYVSYAGSDVSLLSTAADEETARINTPVLSGDRIVTGGSSRAEVVLASGNVVRMDAQTDLRFDLMSFTYESNDERDLLFLLRGGVVAEIRTPQGGERAFRLDTDDATIVVEGRSVARVDAGSRGTEVHVVAGEVEVTGRVGSVVLREGEYALVRGDEDIDTGEAAQPRDRLARFVDERRNRPASGGAASWVSPDYDYEASLAAFDENGSWVYAPSYDRWCWRPSVSADWRPYSHGYWRWVPSGLTWVSYEPWGWLPYHFGTWCREPAFGWVWLPGTAYAPAWVWWSYTPKWVGWCPIGYTGAGGHGSPWTSRATDGLSRLPRVRGRVDPARIDPNGWNYAPLHRIGRRLDPSRDVVRGERLPLRPGDTAIVSTSPLRIDRSAVPLSIAVREALQRAAETGPRRTLTVDEGLTSLLRRDTSRAPAGGADWRGTRAAGDLRVPVDATPRRRPALEGGWRSPASQKPSEVTPRRADRPAPTDTGWRAPRRESPSRSGVADPISPRPERMAPLSERPSGGRAAHAAAPAPPPRPAAPAIPKAAPAPHAAPAAPPKAR